jgi:hypothetical protein
MTRAAQESLTNDSRDLAHAVIVRHMQTYSQRRFGRRTDKQQTIFSCMLIIYCYETAREQRFKVHFQFHSRKL